MNKYSLFALIFLTGCASVDSTGVHSRKNVVRQPIEKRKILLPVEEERVKKSPVEAKVISPPVVEQKKPRQKTVIEIPQHVEVLKKAPPVSPPPQVDKKAKIVKIVPTPTQEHVEVLKKAPPVSPPPQVEKKARVVKIAPTPTQAKEIKPQTTNFSDNLVKGRAIWYSVQEHGKKTASGEVYDLYDMTAAHASLPLSSKVKVRNVLTGRSVIVTINDRLSTNDDAVIKLSYHAARKLKLLKKQESIVEVTPIR